MDIPDVELVVVNGLPDTLTQLYQVTNSHLNWSTPCSLHGLTCTCIYTSHIHVQMFGRAGRNGHQARAHLLYTTRQTKRISDCSLKMFTCEGNEENCRRKEMLLGLGSKESISNNYGACCDICTGGTVLSPRLDILVPTPQKQVRKAKPVRHITDNIKKAVREALIVERGRIVDEFPGFRMIGTEFILSDATIGELCDRASTITSKEDLNDVVLLRPEYHDRLFRVIWLIVSCAPPPKKKQRKRK